MAWWTSFRTTARKELTLNRSVYAMDHRKNRAQSLCVLELIHPLTEGHSLTTTIINTSMIRLVEMHFEAVKVCGEIDVICTVLSCLISARQCVKLGLLLC